MSWGCCLRVAYQGGKSRIWPGVLEGTVCGLHSRPRSEQHPLAPAGSTAQPSQPAGDGAGILPSSTWAKGAAQGSPKQRAEDAQPLPSSSSRWAGGQQQLPGQGSRLPPHCRGAGKLRHGAGHCPQPEQAGSGGGTRCPGSQLQTSPSYGSPRGSWCQDAPCRAGGMGAAGINQLLLCQHFHRLPGPIGPAVS